MRKEEVGIVVEINGNKAKVRASRHGDCENCGVCDGDNAIMLEVENSLSAKPGQKVAFVIPEANMLQAAFVVYILPLIALFVGAFIGWFIANQFGQPLIPFEIVGGIIVFILSIIYVRLYDSAARKNHRMQPRITKILSD